MTTAIEFSKRVECAPDALSISITAQRLSRVPNGVSRRFPNKRRQNSTSQKKWQCWLSVSTIKGLSTKSMYFQGRDRQCSSSADVLERFRKSVVEFLEKNNLSWLPQPPCSPVWVPANFFPLGLPAKVMGLTSLGRSQRPQQLVWTGLPWKPPMVCNKSAKLSGKS